VVQVPHRGERRDVLDQAWTQFLSDCSLEPLPIPNTISDPVAYARRHGARGIVLTGGGNISWSMGRIDGLAAGNVVLTEADLAPERDAIETALLRESVAVDWPVLGVCRGMQAINVFHGGSLAELSGHAGVRHKVAVSGTRSRLSDVTFDTEVNSFHDFGIPPDGLGKGLYALVNVNGWPEAFEHSAFRHLGIMWHPERNAPFSRNDVMLFRRFFDVPAS
jgi:putative glutamine amidotransferase